ncbi:hypothetical protein LCGC14_2358970 [marine sediment metagenome]|uniref:Uncharacterized protein n=1 Tax=marine sediment metagenome TaxID=412755 RepID=A0A0F9F202_9ZZZZ
MGLSQATQKVVSSNAGLTQWTKTFTQLTTPGSTDHIHVPGTRRHTFQVTVAEIDTNVGVTIDGSIDGTNFFVMPVKGFTATGISYTNEIATITGNGTYLIYAEEIAVSYVRFTFASESGGDSSATIDVKYLGSE